MCSSRWAVRNGGINCCPLVWPSTTCWLGLLLAGPETVLEAGDLWGLALFVVVLLPGRCHRGAQATDPARVRAAVLPLRLGVGVFLVVLAFTKKLLAPDLTRQLLTDRPHLDPLQQLGLAGRAGPVHRGGVRDRALPGAADPDGVAPQVLATAVLFNLTLAFFDRFELIGHLPIYGAPLAVLNYGSDPATARTVPTFGHRR